MKKNRATVYLVSVSIALLALTSCESEDPSALGESQKALAEAVAQSARLEDEIASLRAQLDQAKAEAGAEPTVVSESLKIPTLGELEASLGKQSAELMEKARQAHPGAQIEGYQAWDLNIPSFERPFSGKVRVIVREPNGQVKELYWIAAADLKGEWKFQQVDSLSAPGSATQDHATADNSRHVRPPTPDTEPAQDRNPAPTRRPEPPAEKETPQYDIPLDRPIMGPGSR